MIESVVQLNYSAPLVCTWNQLARAFADLHLWDKADVDRLHDVFVNSVPSPQYTVAIRGAKFDERNPRPGDFFEHVINPLALTQWIKEVSAKRGFPFDDRTARQIMDGQSFTPLH